MSDIIKIMRELQRYNDVVFRCRKESAEAAEALSALDTLVKKESVRVAKMKETLTLFRRELKSCELSLSALGEKIARGEERKMNVSSGKELASAESELEKAHCEKNVLEERTFSLMEKIENAESEESSEAAKLIEFRIKEKEKRGMLTERIDRLKSLFEENDAKFKALLPSLERYRAKFEHLATSKDGKAIVSADNGSCSGCNYGISTDVTSRIATSTEPQSCSNCGRYLYVEKA